MTILQLQRRLAEVGRIRLGIKKVSQRGKSYPAKLDTFRLTSPDRQRIAEAANLYGGEPREWEAPAGRQWEVITEATALDVIVPPSDMAFSQHFELWSAAGCLRRCDGVNESISDGPCICDPDRRECEIHTRLSVMLRDLAGLGVWRVDTQGYYAAVELGAAVQVMQAAAGKGVLLPARLRLEQRQVKRVDLDGKPETRKFAVPVLDVDITPRQLLGGNGALAIEPGGAEQAVAALDPGEPNGNLTPVPESVPERPVPSVAEQAAAVEQDDERKPRRNAAEPIPATGLKPRTAAQAATEDPAEEPESDDWRSQPPTSDQHAKLRAVYKQHKIDDATAKAFLAARLGIASHADLERGTMSDLIDWLEGRDTDPGGVKAAEKLREIAQEHWSSVAAHGERANAASQPPEGPDWRGIASELGLHGNTVVAVAKQVAERLDFPAPSKLDEVCDIDHPMFEAALLEALEKRAAGETVDADALDAMQATGGD